MTDAIPGGSFRVSLICYPYFPSRETGRGHDRYIYELQNNLQRTHSALTVKTLHQGRAKNSREAALKKFRFVVGLLRTKADVYHAMSPIGGATAAILGKCPLVVTVHDLLPFDVRIYDHGWKLAYLRFCAMLCFRRGDSIIVGHKGLKQELCSRFSVPAEKVHVVRYGVDHAWYYPRTMRARSDRLILYVGEVSRAKGVDTLIKAFSLVKTSIPDARLLIGGKWSGDQPELERLSRRLGLTTVDFKGFIPESEMPDLYSSATLFVFPSRYGFALPPLEAMACGTPVIVGNVFDAAEFVSDAGILVNPDDPAELARNIIIVLSDPELRSSLSGKGLRRAGEFSWETMARSTADIYRRILQERNDA